jgi:hypothetical protein
MQPLDRGVVILSVQCTELSDGRLGRDRTRGGRGFPSAEQKETNYLALALQTKEIPGTMEADKARKTRLVYEPRGKTERRQTAKKKKQPTPCRG